MTWTISRKEIEDQIELALEAADVILFVVDTRAGLLPLDEEVARRLRYVDQADHLCGQQDR